MIAGILVILALLHMFDFLLKEMGFFSSKISSKYLDFNNDILKPLGYTSKFYFENYDLVCILKVRKMLNEFYNKANCSSELSVIQHYLDTNTMLQEFCLEDLKKQKI